MLAMLHKATRSGTSQAVFCQLAVAYNTRSKAFGLLCIHSEICGLVFVDLCTAVVGAVYYDRDPTWQHEVVSGVLSREVFVQLGRTGKLCCKFTAMVFIIATNSIKSCCPS